MGPGDRLSRITPGRPHLSRATTASLPAIRLTVGRIAERLFVSSHTVETRINRSTASSSYSGQGCRTATGPQPTADPRAAHSDHQAEHRPRPGACTLPQHPAKQRRRPLAARALASTSSPARPRPPDPGQGPAPRAAAAFDPTTPTVQSSGKTTPDASRARPRHLHLENKPWHVLTFGVVEQG